MPAISKTIFRRFINSFPIIVLFTLVFTGFDLSFFFFKYNFSFNFIYLLIFYWTLKKPIALAYGLVFIAGIINDVVQNFPIGISSLNFLILCAIAAFIRTRTILPSLFIDWILFFIAILIVSSINYSILSLIFEIPIKYGNIMISSFITFLVYPIFSKMFEGIYLLNLKQEDA
tara:strand:- start:1102 stop:1620 length:519 start_codon:yes stop_codon:yes gene_type:complete